MFAFNVNQLATYEEARVQKDFLNTFGMGILDFDDEHAKPADKGRVRVPGMFPWLPDALVEPGIFVPRWEGGPAGFQVPSDGDRKFLHFRLKNGGSGMNVGLTIDKLRRFPNAQAYAIGELLKEAASMASK